MISSVVFFILVMLFPMGVMAALAADGPLDPLQGDSPLDAMEETVQARIYVLPLSFIPNVGQLDPGVAFTVTGRGSTLYFTSDAVVITAREGEKSVVHVIRQTFPGSAESPVIEGADLLPGVANYFTGNDPLRWQSNVPTYGSVLYRNLYPGIDISYKGTDGILKREFVVAPGADPAVLRLHYEGVDGIRVDDEGALVISTGNSTLTESPVICYQEINGRQVLIPASYHYDGDRDITFAIGTYDPSFPLVIDPVLVYSTFLGGSSNGNSIAVDSSGNAYVTGQRSYEAVVTKLNPSGSSLVYSTYLGGTGDDIGYGIAVDSSGNAYVTGRTYSSDFPTTVSAFDRTYGGGNVEDAFVAKLNPSGSSLVYSTYLGGTIMDTGYGIAVDSSSNAYVTGYTNCGDFPTTNGAYNRTHGGSDDVFVTKLNPSGSSLVYSSFLGGKNVDIGRGIVVDSSGNAYVTGQTLSSNFPTTVSAYNRTYGGGNHYDAFITKLNPAGSSLGYSTYLGGTGDDTGYGIAVDSSGNTYVTGDTSSSNFPTTVSAYNRTFGGGNHYDAFITKLNPSGSSLVYSTYLGGWDEDRGSGIAVDSSGNAYVTGYTYSSNFPTSDNAFDRIFGGGYMDVFVTKLNPSGSSLVYSTYLGGLATDSGNGIAVDSIGDAYVTGGTSSSDFPTTTGAYNRTLRGGGDGFVAKFVLTDLPLAGSRIGVFRNGVWYLDYNGNGIWNGNAIDRQYNFGIPGDIPITSDWNTTGKTSIGCQRYGSSWFLDYNGNGIWNGTAIDRFSIFGLDDTPVAGDWNGNRKSEIGIFRNGVWYLDYNGNGQWEGTLIDRKYSFGTTGDKPVVGQWNGSAISEIGIFRDNGTWQLDYNGNWIWDGIAIDRQYNFGISGDIPITGDWNNDEKYEIGVYRPSTHLFYLDYNGNGVWNGVSVDRQYNFGLSGDIPISGKW